MEQKIIQQSPNWEKRKDQLGFLEEGFPFQEGFPRDIYQTLNLEPNFFDLILRDGRKAVAIVDTSAQYRAEGLNWQGLHGETIYPSIVIAWRTHQSK